MAVTPTAHWLEYLDLASPILQEPLRIEVDPLSPLRAVLEVMELRTGIEIEAAGLAAERASAAQIRKIVECVEAVDAAHKRGPGANTQELAQQCSLADATAADDSRRAGDAQTRLQRDVSARAPRYRAGDPRWSRVAGARGDAPAPGQQPQTLSAARGKARQRLGGIRRH